MDDVDMAQEAYERQLNKALSSRLNQQTQAESPTNCEDCGHEIPAGRRKAIPGCTRCVACQETIETLEHWRN